MHRLAASVLLFFATMSAPAASQTSPNPVMEHYRAYRAALDQNDLAVAEREADAAERASEARDGDGGRTAVLLLNLAHVRLRLGRAAEALPPAQRAFALAQQGATGVDARLAELTLARAELLTLGAPGADRLEALLATPAALPEIEIYGAAAELGAWAIREEKFERAQFAWSVAAAYPQGALYGEAFGLGVARIAQAAAIIRDEIGSRGGSRMNRDNAHAAYAHLLEADRVLAPLAGIDAPTLHLTYAQRALAESRAWRVALSAKLRADNQSIPETPQEAQGDADGLVELGPVDLSRPRCLMRIEAEPLPTYPRDALDRGGVAGVVLFFRTNEVGDVVSHEVAARVGDPAFAEALERVAPRWRVVKIEEGSAPNCRMAASILQTVRFALAE